MTPNTAYSKAVAKKNCCNQSRERINEEFLTGPLQRLSFYPFVTLYEILYKTLSKTIGVTKFVKVGGTHQDEVKKVYIHIILYINIYIYTGGVPDFVGFE